MLNRDQKTPQPIVSKNYYAALSEEILSTAKLGKDTTSLRRQLYYIRHTKIEKSLDTDALKKTFWINIYNAFYLIILNETKQDDTMYRLKRIKIARSIFSLNDIEHGILRKNKFKIGLGYVTNPFYSGFIKTLAVSKLDYRIHFALRTTNLNPDPFDYFNCDEIESQLATVTTDFIKFETEFDHESKKMIVSQFLFTYLRDFGGIQSIKKMLKTIFKKDFKGYSLKFKPYNRIEKKHHIS
ncbi:DUF547 domain-containing protein [Flavobacterium bomense]|uniref:DUF547 domain-containing protein n=1 Tax=Flavobacterium bomense TaxID=2497483 RepID=A0A432CNK7_9FLAO|nr:MULTISPECIES: DUF547 domain-containing protein [Flavobacterium]RTY65269.1 DUF547 domain-containing protein [Flavobacterium sp. LB2P53]RTZ05630.1 DUF547 domain-containing protein [Flavobacterium bomense]